MSIGDMSMETLRSVTLGFSLLIVNSASTEPVVGIWSFAVTVSGMLEGISL